MINQAPQAVDPVQQVRAAQLAQRILNEVLQKSFDEHSDHNGGRFRCGETVGTPPVIYPACTPGADYGPDGGETRSYAFSDVDDFDTAGNWVDANQFTQTNAEASATRSIATIRSDRRHPGYPVRQPRPGSRIHRQARRPDRAAAGWGELAFALYRGNY